MTCFDKNTFKKHLHFVSLLYVELYGNDLYKNISNTQINMNIDNFFGIA